MFSLFFFLLFVIFVISRFGIEGWVWVLIASVPDLCIFLAFATVREKKVWNMKFFQRQRTLIFVREI